MKKRGLFFLLLFFFSTLFADQLTVDPIKPWPVDCRPCPPFCIPPRQLLELEGQIVVDLMNPTYEDGVLYTDEGGILQAPGLRVQAQKIVYVKKLDSYPPEYSIYCEGDLLVDYQDKALVGKCFYYNFLTSTGMLIEGKTTAPPWYVGGKEIFFEANGELVIYGGYISTSESPEKDVMITSSRIVVSQERILTANHLQFRLRGVPLLWFPKIKLDLKSIGESPFAVAMGYGGYLKTNISLRYRFLTLGELYGYLRTDYYLGRGPGIGIETEYNPCDRPTEFYTRSYYAHDLSIDDPKRKDRYRFEGSYFSGFDNGIYIEGFYDFVSDGDMAADYRRKDFDLNPAERTEIEIRKESCDWIASLFTRVRVNRFQSINQELPTVYYTWRPFEIGSTGVMFENVIKASYLNYRFSDEIIEAQGSKFVHDFHSSRLSIHPLLYRPFSFSYCTLTPHAGFIGIAYSNSQHGHNVGQAIGDFGSCLETTISRCYNSFKHVLEPYVDYHYFTAPRVAVDHAYIFTIQDAYAIFGMGRFGVRNSIYTKYCGCIRRPIYIDLWANAFSNGRHLIQSIPKGYLNIETKPTDFLFLGADGAWNFYKKQLDYCNFRLEWTLSQNSALAFEYRHRSAFDWRKADFYNFLLDVTRTEEALLNSPLSDRRDTFLSRIFYRWNPNFWAKFILRHGWNRKQIPNYTEFEIEFTRVIFNHWHFIFTYENRETDNRFSAALKLAPSPPDK